MKHKSLSLSIVFLIAFIDWMGVGLVYPMFSSMFFHGEASLLLPESSDMVKGFWLGLLLAMMPLAQFMSSPILGAISDQKGRKPVLVATLIMTLLGYLLSVAAIGSKGLFLLLAGRLIIGIASGNAAVANSVLADLSLPDEKAKYYGLLHMSVGIGFTIGPFLGGKLSEISFLTPFLFAAALTFINLLLLIFLFSETHRKKSKHFVFSLNGLEQILRFKNLRYLLLAVFIFRFGWAFYWEFIPVTWLEEYHFSPSQIGNLYAYSAGFYALSCGLLIRPIVSWLKPLYILFIALILTGCCILFSLCLQPEWIYAYLPFQQYLTAFLFPTTTTIISNWVSEENQGEAMGMYQSIESLAFGLSPLLSGCLIGLNHKMPIVVGGVFMLISALILRISCFKEATAPVKPL